MNRRELFQMGALALAVPAEGFSAAAELSVKDPSWRPQLFDAHQNETVVAVTELIIPATDTPGAKAALVNRYIDLLLAEGAAASRTQFLDALGWLDGAAQRRGEGKPFVKLSEADQVGLLKAMDSGSEGEAGKGAFQLLKSWTARVYYATEIGFKELNKGGRAPSTYYFACPEPDQRA